MDVESQANGDGFVYSLCIAKLLNILHKQVYDLGHTGYLSHKILWFKKH